MRVRYKLQAGRISDPDTWRDAMCRQAEEYEHKRMTVFQPLVTGPRQRLEVTVIDIEREQADQLFEGLIQTTMNFYADNGGHFEMWDDFLEGQCLAAYHLKCNCGDEAVQEAERILEQ